MEKLEKIYRGMANGAEAIDSNFQEIAKNIDKPSDIPWTEGTLQTGWALSGEDARIRAKVEGDILTIAIEGLSNTAAMDHTFVNVANFGAAFANISAWGDENVVMFTGNNADGLPSRSRFRKGIFQILPSIALATGTKRYVFETVRFVIGRT
ncbi:hypothetical protein I6I20_11055 [Lactococcus garvieae]|nr:hypothetical protein I6I20_11055 [Lactococcus garvieae]